MMSFWVVPASWPCTSSSSSASRAGLLLGDDLVEREQPHRGGVDRHRGVHLVERDVLEEPPHLAEVRDRHADLADLAARQRRVGVVAGLGGQVEGDREPGLPLGQVPAVERVGLRRRAVPGVGPHHPRRSFCLGRSWAGSPGRRGQASRSWAETTTRRTVSNYLVNCPTCQLGHSGVRRRAARAPTCRSTVRIRVKAMTRRTAGRAATQAPGAARRARAAHCGGEHPQRGDVDRLDRGQVDDHVVVVVDLFVEEVTHLAGRAPVEPAGEDQGPAIQPSRPCHRSRPVGPPRAGAVTHYDADHADKVAAAQVTNSSTQPGSSHRSGSGRATRVMSTPSRCSISTKLG